MVIYRLYYIRLNTELTHMRKLLHRLQSIYASSKMNSNPCSFKVYRSLYMKKLLSTKSSYVTDWLYKYGTSSKQAYNLSYSLVSKSKPKHLPDQPDTVLCSSFANFLRIKYLTSSLLSLILISISSLSTHFHYLPIITGHVSLSLHVLMCSF